MESMTQFVGKGGNIPEIAGEIQKQVGGERRGHSHAVGSPSLAGSGEHIDAALGEKCFDNRSVRGIEAGVGIKDDIPCLVETVPAPRRPHRRVDVAVFQLR